MVEGKTNLKIWKREKNILTVEGQQKSKKLEGKGNKDAVLPGAPYAAPLSHIFTAKLRNRAITKNNFHVFKSLTWPKRGINPVV